MDSSCDAGTVAFFVVMCAVLLRAEEDGLLLLLLCCGMSLFSFVEETTDKVQDVLCSVLFFVFSIAFPYIVLLHFQCHSLG